MVEGQKAGCWLVGIRRGFAPTSCVRHPLELPGGHVLQHVHAPGGLGLFMCHKDTFVKKNNNNNKRGGAKRSSKSITSKTYIKSTER